MIKEYDYKFKKEDIITITQKEDGGWWEGTSRETGKTGWFPSNYVSEIKESTPTTSSDTNSPSGATTVASLDPTTAAELLAQQIENRQQVIRDLIEKENEFVQELENLHSVYLEPLSRGGDIMPMIEYKHLIGIIQKIYIFFVKLIFFLISRVFLGNIETLIEVHKTLALNLDEESPTKKSPREQRVGKVLLANGAAIKNAHMVYWGNHPKAVSILERHREALDAFMENQGRENIKISDPDRISGFGFFM